MMEEIDTKQSIKFSLWRELFKYAAPYKKDFVWLCVIMAFIAAVDAVQPFLTGWAVDRIAIAGRLDRLPIFITIYGLLMVLQAFSIKRFHDYGGRVEMGMNYGI